jgi:hypothetical protein
MTKPLSKVDIPVAKKGPGFGESTALMALMISLVALSVDSMLSGFA